MRTAREWEHLYGRSVDFKYFIEQIQIDAIQSTRKAIEEAAGHKDIYSWPVETTIARLRKNCEIMEAQITEYKATCESVKKVLAECNSTADRIASIVSTLKK